MTVQIIKADLFSMEVDALAHGVNCSGVMGKGIAKEFKRRFPSNYQDYVRQCQHYFMPGHLKIGAGDMNGNPIAILNLAIQDKAKPNTAQYVYVYDAMRRMMDFVAPSQGWKVAMPWIGCGIGGLHKDGVESIVRHVFDDWEGVVYICEVSYE